jgi:two-component system, cell cycle sensor histidine kinase and response regulator CckA
MPTESLNLFVVEDDDDIALLVRKSLERAGHRVTRCRTGTDALTVLGHTTFDLVLLDQKLPDLAGAELLQALARESIVVPALMVTGHGDEHLASQVLRAGALDYVVKDPELSFLAELPKRVVDSVTRHRLQQTNRLLVAALESAGDGVMVTDLHGTIIHVNRALEQLTGYQRDELIGQKPSLLKSGQHPAEFYRKLWETVLARGVWQGELTNHCKDGHSVEVSLTVSPVLDGNGQSTHLTGILRDVSERKHLERQLMQAQKMQGVGTLAAGVAHEFNNLLAGISGYASLALHEAGLGEPAAEFMRHVVTLSERAARLTRQLLIYARKPELTRKPTAVLDLVAATADLMRQTVGLEATLDVPAPGGPPLLVSGDANQLQQALVNLGLNARDAAIGDAALPPASAITFRVRSRVLTEELKAFPQNIPPGDYVLIEVHDCGCGMTPEVLGQAIDPFFTTKEVGQGTGLGLPMAFGIVQGHLGHLTIDSAPGRGTSVGLYLPRLESPPAAETGQPAFEMGQVIEPEAMPSRTILVVDDEEAVLDVVCRFLEIAGHRVVGVTCGQDALDHLRRTRDVDLVILDLMMPREDGFQTLQRVRLLRPGLPVLLCSGLPQAEALPEPVAGEAAGLLRKPFKMNELWWAVRKALA